MWRTSEVNRVLTDAEWAVFRVGLELLWDFEERASGHIDRSIHRHLRCCDTCGPLPEGFALWRWVV
jgi:hypothetical protein